MRQNIQLDIGRCYNDSIKALEALTKELATMPDLCFTVIETVTFISFCSNIPTILNDRSGKK